MAEHQHGDTGNLPLGDTVTDIEVIAPTERILENVIVEETKDNEDISKASDASSDTTESTLLWTSLIIDENQSPGLHRFWGHLARNEYDVITVHGLRDDYRTAWKSSKRESWLRSWLFKDMSISIFDFLYAADDSARIFQRGGIKAEAQHLMREYIEQKKGIPDMGIDRPIVWVCHDIGGSIVKEVLIETTRATNREDYDDVETWEYIKDARKRIATLSTAIISIGCPHRPRPMDMLEEEIHNLIMLPGPDLSSDLMEKVKIMANQVNETNVQFLDTNFFSRIVNGNVFYDLRSVDQGSGKVASSDMATPALEPDHTMGSQRIAGDETRHTITGASQSVMDPSSITIENPGGPFNRHTLTLNSMFEIHYRYPQDEIDHLGLVNGEKSSDRLWAVYHSKLFTQSHHSLKISTDLIHDQIALLSMMPPRKMPKAHIHLDVKGDQELPILKWIASQAAYKDFYENYGPQVLHIECTAGDRLRTSMLSQTFYDMYERSNWKTAEDGSKSSFYFEFDKFDTRYNTIESMLITFLNEITWRFWHSPKDSPTIRRVFESLNYYRCWTLVDLFKLFTEVRKCPSVSKFTLILGCWDNCAQEERTWFLSRVLEQHRHNDLDYRLVITTSGPDDFLKNSIRSSQVLSLVNCPVPVQGYALDDKYPLSGLGLLLEDLLQKCPALKNIQAVLEQVMDECQGTPYMGYIILNWLSRSCQGHLISDIAATIKQLRTITPDHILATIIGNLSPKEQKLARIIYRWVRYAMEPLTIEALSHAVAVSLPLDCPSLQDVDCEDLLEELDKLFCGVIILDGREIKFSHDSFYCCPALPEPGGGNNLEQSASIHGELARVCLNYLLREEVLQKRYSKFSVDNHGGGLDKCLLLLPRDDLLDYAVRLWVAHYRLSDQYQPVDLALRFLQNKQARNKWAEAYYLLSNPFTRIHRSYISPLPLMAALGLEDVVSRQIKEEKDSHWFQNDCWLAVTEAGRNGHTAVLRKLLNFVQVHEHGLQDAIYWSTFSGNEKIMALLLDKVGSLNNFPFPSSLLSLASAAGLEDLVSVIVKRADCNLSEPNPEIGNQTALQTAVYWGRKTVAELLLNSGADTSIQDGEGETPLLLSIRMGDPDIVQLFLESQKNICDDQKLGLSLINAAITAGELGTLRCVLMAGADCKAGEFDPSSNEFRFPIIHAAAYGRLYCLRLLLESGADACTESKEGSVLYILSANLQAIDSCRTLLEKGALHHQCYSDKEMLLSRALRANNRRLIELLIEKGAQLDIADTYAGAVQKTPLSFAATTSSTETLKFLLDKGANPNYIPEAAKSTLLYIAAYYRCETTKVELLLKRGADVHRRRSDGWTPLHAAYYAPALLPLLLDYGSDINAMSDQGTVLMMAARWNSPETVKILLSRKSPLVDLNVKLDGDKDDLEYGKTALDLAIQYGHYKCANLMLEAGARVDVDSVNVAWIVYRANKYSEEEALTLMEHCLQRGLKINGTDDSNKTALHHITRNTPKSFLRLLIQWGCQVNALDSDGLTPLAIAVRHVNITAARYLVRRGARADDDAAGSWYLLHQALTESFGNAGITIKMMKILIEAGADPLQRVLILPKSRCFTSQCKTIEVQLATGFVDILLEKQG